MYGPGKFTGGYEAGVQGLAQAMIIQNKSPAPLLPGRAPRWWRVAGGPMHTPGAWIGDMYGPGKFTGGYEAGVQGLAQAMIVQNKSPAPLLPGRAPPVVARRWGPRIRQEPGLVLICTDRV